MKRLAWEGQISLDESLPSTAELINDYCLINYIINWQGSNFGFPHVQFGGRGYGSLGFLFDVH